MSEGQVPDPPLAWVVGAGGLVGRHVAAELTRSGHEVMTTDVPWADEEASIDVLAGAVRDFARARGGRAWSLAWCAGAGVVATGEAQLAAEVRVFERVMAEFTASVRPEEEGALFLASSAGGLYAGSARPPFHEGTKVRPLVAYGRAKLAMERHASDVARASGIRVVLGRLANVYGPGQRLGKPQGLLSQLCLSDATRRPLPVFVSLDTIRDYLYAADAGRMVVRTIELAGEAPSGSVVVKVLASGRPVTVSYLVSESRRVFHRPLRTIPVGGASAGQVLDLRLESRVWPEVDALATTPLAAGLASTSADVRARVVAGGSLDG